MGRALDDYLDGLWGELRTGGATLDELYNLAQAIKEDLDSLESQLKESKEL